MRFLRFSALALACSFGPAFIQIAYCQAEASRVRILLVLDTLDRMGATWGLDGDNMLGLFEHAFKKQGLVKGKQFTIDVLTGKQVTPKQVLDYYTKLDVGDNEALVFYYSGHGGFHGKKGHFMALTLGHQQLYRSDILKAMEAKKPRLKVLLTDCCANLSGGAWQDVEPAGAVVQPRQEGGEAATPRAAVREPPAKIVSRGDFKPIVFQEPPRPEIPIRKLPKAKVQEPPGEVQDNKGSQPSKTKKATQAEPDAILTKYVMIRTPTGAVPYHEVLAKVDGKIMRQLFFQHKGVVDINGCPKGVVSQGALPWGGSLFTLAFVHLQAEDFAKLDADGNGFIDWREIFTSWVSLTQRLNRGLDPRNKGRYIQTPEAWQIKATK